MPKDLDHVRQGKVDAMRSALRIVLQSAPVNSLRVVEAELDRELEKARDLGYIGGCSESYLLGFADIRDRFKAGVDAVDRIGSVL